MRTSDRTGRAAGRFNEQGSVTMLVGLTMTLMLMMVVAGMVVGRYNMYKNEVQNAADAAALAAVHSLTQYGKPGGALNEDAARSLAQTNSRLVLQDIKIQTLHQWGAPQPPQHRALVQVDLKATFDTFQELLPYRNISFEVQSFAQVNEQIFSETWPALTIVVDASDSMRWPILGSSGISAWSILRNVITTFVGGNSLPVRAGLVIYRGNVVEPTIPPPNSNAVSNVGQIIAQVNNTAVPVPPNPVFPNLGKTNTYGALQKAWEHQRSVSFGRNVLLISDGEPTVADNCIAASAPDCPFIEARNMADKVRRHNNDGAGAMLFTVEIARTNSTPDTTKFLQDIAGAAGSGGGDELMYRRVQSYMGIITFLRYFAYNICAFGPLEPGEGATLQAMEVLDAANGTDLRSVRRRPVTTNLANPGHERVAVFIQNRVSKNEIALQRVPNQVTYASCAPVAYNWRDEEGFEFLVDDCATPPQSYVILTLRACNRLGSDPNNRVVVRWGEPELTVKPTYGNASL